MVNPKGLLTTSWIIAELVIFVAPVLDNGHEKQARDDIAYIAEHMPIVSKGSPGVEAQVVVVAGVQVA